MICCEEAESYHLGTRRAKMADQTSTSNMPNDAYKSVRKKRNTIQILTIFSDRQHGAIMSYITLVKFIPASVSITDHVVFISQYVIHAKIVCTDNTRYYVSDHVKCDARGQGC